VAHLTLPEVDANASWARTFLVEDPTLDITGQEFLVWQIEYYAHVLHKNWTTFWTGAPSASPPVSDSWGDAFSYFLDGVDQMVVSYSTDPAYAAYNGGEGSFNATGTWWNGTEYAWRTIYGIGIVAGSRHRALDQEFEQWFLSGAVQSQIPTTEWEYPANQSVVIPPSADFSYAIPTGSLVPLNNFTTPAEVGSSLLGWVNTWYDLTVGHG